MTKIVLNMIVKDEAHIIEETLENLVSNLAFDYWVISDTGSTDQTPEIIKTFFKEKGIKGELFYDKWQNFAHNRNKALEHARGKGDYIFVFDADDKIEGELSLPDPLTADAYYLEFSTEFAETVYRRISLFKNRPDIYWRGVLHEFIDLPEGSSISTILGAYRLISRRKGSRNLDEKKYLKDAQLLEKAILDNQDPDLLPRYVFYCGRSYRDADEPKRALPWFEKRAHMTEGWSEEAYCSALTAGNLYENQGNLKMADYWWEQATVINPKRAEAWHQLARSHRERQEHHLAFAFAYMAKDLEADTANLFVWQSSYDYWVAFELLSAGVQLGRFQEAYEGFSKLLKSSQKELARPFYKHLENFLPYLDADILQYLAD
ncbi:glycosyl transferase family protein [Streptococcus criceti]|uniref:Glycosyltransferase 2-like domain-containing protein n=1 Tax=Streptococcus criceti HS-6 TaxID=873449 RepID=G5JSA6_STRCG|nr:glycosyltransferase [Streptococcus criceti]EHI74568.1 hypothetical protein STRCR_0884 [Streptococcus criceti HS-6]SUN37468.1 glycosyl transferase family protein [Streptococcus criceti]